MRNILKILTGFLVVNFFYFSTGFYFLPASLNTKMILAGVGLALVGYDVIKSRSIIVCKELFVSTFFGAMISFMVLMSTTYNNTQDYTYLDYVVSMWVWFSGAYAVCRILKVLYGDVSVEILSDNIIATSVFQVLLAFCASVSLPVKLIIKSLVPGTDFLDSIDRLYGLGEMTALDVGGMRYAVALILVCCMIVRRIEAGQQSKIPIYLLSFVLIVVFGNIVARTTTVGAILGLTYLALFSGMFSTRISLSGIKIMLWVASFIAITITTVSFFYRTNDSFRENVRFAFEGFFSFVETGHWQVDSNDKLATMYVFPDNGKTWIIGDGYIVNPDSTGDNYIGKQMDGNFYMGTDVGYLRFLFYFGFIGLFIFVLFFLVLAKMSSDLLPSWKRLVLFILLAHFLFWFKVATDCFFIFSLIMSVGLVSTRDELELSDEDNL